MEGILRGIALLARYCGRADSQREVLEERGGQYGKGAGFDEDLSTVQGLRRIWRHLDAGPRCEPGRHEELNVVEAAVQRVTTSSATPKSFVAGAARTKLPMKDSVVGQGGQDSLQAMVRTGTRKANDYRRIQG